MLNVAIRAARAAADIINHAALDIEAVRVSRKQANDFVTEVDHASEQAIIDILLGAYPEHGILAEESGQAHGNPQAEHIWIIDPLDGTTNFIHGFPVYCISIALSVKGQIELGLIFDPTRNDLFTAVRNHGSFLNNRRIRVSKRTRLSESLLTTGRPPRDKKKQQPYVQMMLGVLEYTSSVRRPGAAALDLAYVAAGFSDGFFESGLKPWDIAAGSLLVTEAGGLIGNFTGDGSQLLHGLECLAASPKIYGQLVALLTPFSRYQASADEKPRPDPDAAARPRLSLQKQAAAHAGAKN